MTLAFEIKRRARQIVGPVIGCLLLGYFIFHAVEGDRGLHAWQALDVKIEAAESKLAALEATRELGVGGQIGRKNLDRDILPRFEVGGAIDDSHSAHTELLLQLEGADAAFLCFRTHVASSAGRTRDQELQCLQ